MNIWIPFIGVVEIVGTRTLAEDTPSPVRQEFDTYAIGGIEFLLNRRGTRYLL